MSAHTHTHTCVHSVYNSNTSTGLLILTLGLLAHELKSTFLKCFSCKSVFSFCVSSCERNLFSLLKLRLCSCWQILLQAHLASLLPMFKRSLWEKLSSTSFPSIAPNILSFSYFCKSVRLQTEEGDDCFCNGFVSLSWWVLDDPVLVFYCPVHIKTPTFAFHACNDPAHLEPVCFSILSSPAVISNQPIGLSLSRHRQPGFFCHLIWVRGMMVSAIH